MLTAEQVTASGAVEVLPIPVRSLYTIDATRATKVVDSLKPRLAALMHYRTPTIQVARQPVATYLSGQTVERATGSQVTLSAKILPRSATVLVLGYETTEYSRLKKGSSFLKNSKSRKGNGEPIYLGRLEVIPQS